MNTEVLSPAETLLLANLTPTQRRAVEAIDRHLVIEAGAGSGKTRVLTHHFVYLLIHGPQPLTIEQVLLVTFTRKAAAEMQDRVRSLLQELASLEDVSGKRARIALQQLDRAWIGTFDSLCGRLLHEYALLGDLDPRFTILEEHAAPQVQRQVLEALITARDREASIGAAFAAIYAESAWYRSQDSASLDEFIEQFRHLYERVRLGTLGALTIESIGQYAPMEASALFDEMAEALAETGINPPTKGPSKALYDACLLHLPGILAAADEADWEAVVSGFANDLAPFSFSGGGSNEVKWLKSLISKKRLDATVYPAIAEQIAAPLTAQLATLLIAFDQAYTRAKQQLGVLDFTDLGLRLYHLLSDPAHGWLIGRLRERFRHVLVDEFQDTNRAQCALLRTLGALEETPDLRRPGATICVVGDPKQSIYGFREADLDEYLRFRDETLRAVPLDPAVAQSAALIHLTTNYRSRTDILALGNSLLPHLEAKLAADDSYTSLFVPEAALIPGIDFSSTPDAPCTLLAPYRDPEGAPPTDGGPADPQEYTAWLLGLRLRTLVELGTPVRDKRTNTLVPLDWGHIAILVRAAADFRPLEKQFRRLGVPYTVVAGHGFFEATEVQDVLQVLRLLIHPGDDLACAAVLRGPMCGLSIGGLLTLTEIQSRKPRSKSDIAASTRPTLWSLVADAATNPQLDDVDHAACAALVQLIDRLRVLCLAQPLPRVLEELYLATDLPTIVLTQDEGLRRFANLQKLQQFAADYPIGDHEAVRQFVSAMAEYETRMAKIGEAGVDVPGDGAISLLTIHKAKGLEWPLVVLHGLHKSPNNATDRWGWSRDVGLGLSIQLPGLDSATKTSAQIAIATDLKARDSAERLRLLYVALTRAEDRLLLSGTMSHEKMKGAIAKGWLRDLYDWGGSAALSPDPLARDEASVAILDPVTIVAESADRVLPSPADQPDAAPESWDALLLQLETPSPRTDRLPAQINVTALATFARCPAKHRYQYLQEMPADRLLIIDQADRGTTSRAAIGRALHRLLQLVLDEAVVVRAGITEVLCAQLLIEADATPTPQGIRELSDLAARYLATPILHEAQSEGQRRFTELELQWWLPQVNARGETVRIYLQGKPDLVLARSDGSWLVIDYKTFVPSAPETGAPDTIALQLTAYAQGIARWQGLSEGAVAAAILAPDAEGSIVYKPIPLDPGQLQHALNAFIEAHQAEARWSDPGMYHVTPECHRCDFHAICPEIQKLK